MSTEAVTDIYGRLCAALHRRKEPDELAVYWDLLGDEDPVLLRSATDNLLKSEDWPTPSKIVREIRRLQSESPTEPAEPPHWRRATYRCLACQDTGLRTIWDPKRALPAALSLVMGRMDERTFRGRINKQVVRCTCQAGLDYPSRQRRGREPVELPVFREEMVEVKRTGTSQEIEDLIAWAKSWKPTNYVREFDDF